MRIAFLLIALMFGSAPALAQSPLDQFRGHFRGSAKGTFTSGASESFTCVATNGGSGQDLTINMRCANSSGAKFEIRTRLTLSGSGGLSGTWRIVDPSYDGTISGLLAGSRVQVSITGAAFKGTATVTRNGAKLDAAISIADGVRVVASLQ